MGDNDYILTQSRHSTNLSQINEQPKKKGEVQGTGENENDVQCKLDIEESKYFLISQKEEDRLCSHFLLLPHGPKSAWKF